MPKEQDPFRKYVKDLDKRKWRCTFCNKEFAGSTPRIRAHLANIPGYGIKPCEKVEDPVRAEALETFNGKGSRLDKSMGGTSGKGTERTSFGASQSVLPSDDALNTTDTRNSNRHGCALQQPSFYPLTGAGTAPAGPQDDDASNPNHMQNSNQLWCTLQQPSFYQPTGTGTAPVCPQDQVSLPPSHMPLDNLDNTQQSDPSNRRLDAAHGNEIASRLQQPMDCSALSSSDLSELLASPKLPTHLGFGDWSNLHPSPPENLLESCVIANASEEIETDELHNSTVGSSLQTDPFLDVDKVNRLQDCGQPPGVEVVPVPGGTSPNDPVQHPGWLPPSRDKEDGNDIHRFLLPTPMYIDPSTASQQLEASTNTIGPSSAHASVPPQRRSILHQYINLETVQQNPTVPPSSWKNQLVTCHSETLMDMDPCMPSSSQAPNNAPPPQILPRGTGLIGQSSLPELDMNEGAPMMSHPNTGSNFEENKALKRKLELLYRREVEIRDELNFAASLCLKKLRMDVVNWLVNVEKLRIDCTEAASEDCLPPHQQVDILMQEAEDIRRQGKGLFEARETKHSKLLEEKMVGEAFQRNTMEILEYLAGNQISRLGICGMGGVGKTTIMVHTHNRLVEKPNDGKVLWLTVSEDFNTWRLQDAIGEELRLDIQQEKDMRKRATKLCNRLMEIGKVTVILDDVWKHFDLKEVGIPDKADNIKLVLTTRSVEVCHQMQCQEMIRIEPLSHTEAESLFLEELGSEVALDLETRIAIKSIVRECAGLPLAIITMARSMRGVTDVFEWKDYLEKLRESDMGKTDMETQVLKKLEFSYKCLGNHEIQQCFLSCALYPEDKLIDKFELIEFFIDQGLIGRLNMREKQYIRGLTILNKLANVCLLEVHGSMMKMHDLIRDMALHVMNVTSIVKAGKGLRKIPSEDYWTDVLEKVSLMKNDIEEFPLNMSPNCPKLSIFLMNENFCFDVIIPDSFFKQLRGLEVLNLSGCNLRELPDSISDLLNLRALLLRNCTNLCSIPYLGKLRSLRKLDIFYCKKVEALEGLEKLVDLRYLDISGTRLKQLPKGTLGALLNLQYLNAEGINVGGIAKLGALETFTCFLEDVDDFNEFVRMASKQRKHCYKYISMDQGRPNAGVEVTGDAQFGHCERTISIKSWSHAIMSAGRESSGSGICILIPQDVKRLEIFDCHSITDLSDMSPLEDLEELMIGSRKNLRMLHGGQDEEVIDIHNFPAPLLFPRLRDLFIYHCSKLKYLFGHGLIFSLQHLRCIKIEECDEMVGITVAVRLSPPHLSPAFPNLERIYIHDCVKMKRVVESEWLPDFLNLKKIQVFHCDNMEEIIGGPLPYMPVEEISLEDFGVVDCDNLRKLFPHELLSHLRNLQSIHVSGCKGMVEMISRAGQGQEGGIMTSVNNTPSSFQSSISLPKLNTLWLTHLPQLKSLCEDPIICYSMETLFVWKCPELNRIPLQLQLRDIKDLPYITVEDEEMWKMLIWDHPNAQAILQPHLRVWGTQCTLGCRHNS